MESPSIGLTLVEYTQAPSLAVLRLAYHFIVPPVPRATATAVFTMLFFMQTSLFALPAWLLMRRVASVELNFRIADRPNQ